jgi:hypothetical protein
MGSGGTTTRLARAAALLAAASVAVPAAAEASTLIDRDATNVRLQVSKKGQALLTYRARGRTWRVLAWGGLNARPPDRDRAQISFRLDYSGGWGTYRRHVWRTFKNGCRPYDGPQLAWSVTACKAPDGSYWAVQSWQRMLPNLGYDPWRPEQRVWELRLSHWTGPVAQLDVWLDWVYSRRFHHLFGRYTYRGQPVYGYRTTSTGAPLDRYGRNLYLDTFNSAYGQGWRRENSFVSQSPNGVFCYGFFERQPYAGYPARSPLVRGNGQRYRITVIGPGVTPDVMWEADGLNDYDPANPADVAREREVNAVQDQLTAGSRLCRQH